MHKIYFDEEIKFPDYWDEEKVLKALTTLGTFELYEYFGCANASSFTRLLGPCMPKRPTKTSYSAYTRALSDAIAKIEAETVTEADTHTVQQEKFMKIYKKGKPFNTTMLNALEENERDAYKAWAVSVDEEKKYKEGNYV